MDASFLHAVFIDSESHLKFPSQLSVDCSPYDIPALSWFPTKLANGFSLQFWYIFSSVNSFWIFEAIGVWIILSSLFLPSPDEWKKLRFSSSYTEWKSVTKIMITISGLLVISLACWTHANGLHYQLNHWRGDDYKNVSWIEVIVINQVKQTRKLPKPPRPIKNKWKASSE